MMRPTDELEGPCALNQEKDAVDDERDDQYVEDVLPPDGVRHGPIPCPGSAMRACMNFMTFRVPATSCTLTMSAPFHTDIATLASVTSALSSRAVVPSMRPIKDFMDVPMRSGYPMLLQPRNLSDDGQVVLQSFSEAYARVDDDIILVYAVFSQRRILSARKSMISPTTSS